MRYAMNLLGLSPDALQVSDVNADGAVDAADALIIIRAVMGIIEL